MVLILLLVELQITIKILNEIELNFAKWRLHTNEYFIAVNHDVSIWPPLTWHGFDIIVSGIANHN